MCDIYNTVIKKKHVISNPYTKGPLALPLLPFPSLPSMFFSLSSPLFSLPGSPIVYINHAVSKKCPQHLVLQYLCLRKIYLMKRECGPPEGKMAPKPKALTVHTLGV